MGSRPASMDYGRRDMPLQGIAEHHGEGVGAHPVTFDSGSDIGSEMGSRPGSQPASPRGGARVSHLVCFPTFNIQMLCHSTWLQHPAQLYIHEQTSTLYLATQQGGVIHSLNSGVIYWCCEAVTMLRTTAAASHVAYIWCRVVMVVCSHML